MRLVEYCKVNKINLALRGELCGQGHRGSGNPINPHAKTKPHIEFFFADNYDNHTKKLSWSDTKSHLHNMFYDWDNYIVMEYFMREFISAEELINTCNLHFKYQKEINNRIIEGIVVRTEDGKFSCKIMNMEYDAKK